MLRNVVFFSIAGLGKKKKIPALTREFLETELEMRVPLEIYSF